ALHCFAAMPPAARDADKLLTQLEAFKNRFDEGHSAAVAQLLAQLSKLHFDDCRQLNRFHECLLFLRAFPHSASQITRVERLLNTFHGRIEKLRALVPDLSSLDEFDTSGIAGTTMQDTLSFDVAQWLVNRIPRNIEIAWDDYWDDYGAERTRGNLWPRFIPLLEEDAAVEANIPWVRWLDAARGRRDSLPWLLSGFARLPLTSQEQAELYDSLRLPLRWKLDNLKLSRTRNWTRPRRFYFHDAPLIQRSDVSLARELARTAPTLKKLTWAEGEAVIEGMREMMVVRYRELYGGTFGDPRTVVRADLGRGVIMHFWGLPPDRRLPLRAYLAGYTVKSGIPINYFEAIGLCDWIELGFNTFYTYRQGETAWVYAQVLRCLRSLTGANCISIYPYQIGQDNDEAIDSGAFWFYRKLGFRSGRGDLEKLCAVEEKKIASRKGYRTPARTLKKLAEAHMFYEPRSPEAKSEIGVWDKFSIRNIGLRVNRRMAQEFNGDAAKIRDASTRFVARILRIDSKRLNRTERKSLEDWSLVLALIPGLANWTAHEKRQLAKIVRAKIVQTKSVRAKSVQAKSVSNEMNYLRLTRLHPRLRSELLRLGSG
ncbi:MAG: hypothetical protein WBX38_15895, partial [Candidatus Sulfotelmatobacter sp.]